jgi:Zn-dependent M16 (insulinase) family peptidase
MLRRGLLRRCPSASLITPANLTWARGDERPDKTKLFPVGSVHHGFKVVEITPVEDLRLTVFRFEHVDTGSIVHHIDSNDKNNAFCIGFGTPATSDRGTTHVLEHTVLCGSSKYPVKDPFFHMLRRSLSTFMNAMTGADYTLYPFATLNPQDYQNLLDVYLDAVFIPLLRLDDFRQEGHRLEPVLQPGQELGADENSVPAVKVIKGVAFNGVVYNEMLGVVSEAPRHFMQELQRTMLTGTHYDYLSGGYPPDILDLTHDELVQYHRRHYTPWNAVAITYGDMDPEPTLLTLHRYYSHMHTRLYRDSDSSDSRAKERVVIPSLTEWRDSRRETSTTGPAGLMGNPEKQTKIAVSFAIPPAKGSNRLDRDSLVRLSVLDTLLTDGPASPMYKRLVSEGQLGQAFAPMTGFASHYTTPLLSFGVDQVDRNAVKPSDVETAVREALDESIKNGFDKRRVDSTVFQTELSQRHRSSNYGVNVCVGLTSLALTIDAEPAQYLNWLPALKEIQKNPQVLQEQLDAVTDAEKNRHSATFTMHADPEHTKKLEAVLEAKLKVKNDDFHRATKSDPLMAERLRSDHEQWLARIQKPQSGDLLPTLKVSDISPSILKEPPMRMVHDGVEIIETEANGLVYVSMLIPARESAFDPARFDPQSPRYNEALMSPMLTSLVTALGTKKHNFEEFDVEAQLVCSHIGFGGNMTQRAENEREFICGNTSGFYTTMDRLPAALALLKEVLLEPRLAKELSSKERQFLSTIVCARAARKTEGIQRDGHHIAAMRSYSNVSFAASLGDSLNGLTQAQFMEKLKARLTGTDANDQQTCLDEILAARDERILDLRARSHELGCDVWSVCDPRNSEAVALALRDFRQELTANTKVVNASPRTIAVDCTRRPAQGEAARKETIELPINASYAGMCFEHSIDYMSRDQQALRIALQMMKSEHLHMEIRELGGAYGVTTEATLGGIAGGVAFASYRDPTPDRSLKTFSAVGEWLSNQENITQQRIDEAKLRLFGSIDHPVTCSSYGTKKRLNGLSEAGEQSIRDMLLDVSRADILSVAESVFLNQQPRTAVLSAKAKETLPADAAAAEPEPGFIE